MMDPPSSIPSNHPWMTIESPMEARMMDISCQKKDTMNDCTPKVGMEFDTLVRLASRAVEIEEAYALVESVTKELEKQVEDIAMKFSSVSLDNSKDQKSLGGSEIVDHGEPIKNLVEKVKGLKKKEENNNSSLINYNNSISLVQCYSHKETD
nr:hypothetical protein CFP56_18345 [Quercus suber]